MNTFSVVSRVLVLTAVVFVGSANCKTESIINDFKKAMHYVAPIAVKKGLKHQNPYVSAYVEGVTATVVRKNDFSVKNWKEDSIYLVTNSGARGIATIIAANTSLNEKNFKKFCDDNLWESVSEVVKVVAPFGVEFLYDSAASFIAYYAINGIPNPSSGNVGENRDK